MEMNTYDPRHLLIKASEQYGEEWWSDPVDADGSSLWDKRLAHMRHQAYIDLWSRYLELYVPYLRKLLKKHGPFLAYLMMRETQRAKK
jgi:hypothetical protein